MTKDETITHLRSLADTLEQGKKFQVRYTICGKPGEWSDVSYPSFTLPIQQYRAKPEPREWRLFVPNNRGYAPFVISDDYVTSTPGTIVHVREVVV